MLEPIEFPARPESRITKLLKAVGRFENNYPNLTMYIAWVALGVALVASVAVGRPA